MSKLWDFPTNGTNYIGEVHQLMKKYAEGLNNQQKDITANIDVSIDNKTNAVVTLNILYTSIFKVTVKFDGKIVLVTNYYGHVKKDKLKDINELEKKIDSIIKSNDMGMVIRHLITCSNHK